MKIIKCICLAYLFATPALALTPEQIAQQQLVIQQQQEQALQNERNRNWFKGGNANIDSNSYEKAASQVAKDRMIQEGIFDLKNYGNENTNTMDSSQWLSNYGNSETIQNGSLSLVSDAVNSSVGNGVGKGELISIGTLATVAVASYYGTKYVGSKIEQQDGESYGDAKKRFQENNPLFAVDEKFGELVITGVAGGADYISGDLQLGTKTLVKVGEGYEWLDNKTGGNLEEILDVGAIVAAAGTATKATSSTAKAGKTSEKGIPHKNSNCYGGNCWLYRIDNKTTGIPYKIGETGVPHRQNGTLPRPQSQVSKLNKAGTDVFEYKELGQFKGKAEVRKVETETILDYRDRGFDLPGNKGVH